MVSSYQITGMGFYWPYQGGVNFRRDSDKDKWLDIKMCRGSSEAKYPGTGTLARKKRTPCEGHFYLYKRQKKQTGQREAGLTDNGKRTKSRRQRTMVNIQQYSGVLCPKNHETVQLKNADRAKLSG